MHSLRQLTLHTPQLSGNQALHVRRIAGTDGLSQLFSYDVTLLAKSENVKFSDVLGHEMCVGLALPKGGERYFHGYVASFSSLGSEGEYTVYRAELSPHLWRLTRSVNCRIFQNATVPEIVEGILKEYGIDFKPDYDGGNRKVHYLPWNYCVQYRETDFAFISRLLEHEGMHYYFRHERGKHTLVIADSNIDVKSGGVAGYEKVEYTRAHNTQNRRDGADSQPPELIWDLRVTSNVLPDRVTLTDYDFRAPKEPLARDSGSEVKREHGRALPDEYELYDHVATVVQQDGYSAELTADYARMRAEEAHVRYAVISAETDARGLSAGAVVSLINGPESSKDVPYLILHSELSAEMDGRSSGHSGLGAPVYHCRFEAIDQRQPFRPARVTAKPIISGPQSAIVAGPAGEKDVATDEWGRVFVKFHWARKLKDDERDLSCWLRVSQNSVGSHWGSMFIPHVGTEVLVGFIEGDPDRPVVIGCVYNGANRPPLALPDNRYKSILRDDYGNEIIFDGTPGNEHIACHSPSDDSVFVVGKGKKSATSSEEVKVAKSQHGYVLGPDFSYTRGGWFAVKAGGSTSVDLGVKVDAVFGTELKIASTASFEFKGGTNMSILASSSIEWGLGTELKKTRGGYTRMSSGDVVLDSATRILISGGPHDYSLLESSDEALVLSFDKNAQDRRAELEAADRRMTGVVGTLAATAATLSSLGAGAYDMAEFDAKKNVHGSVSPEAQGLFDRLKQISAGDVATGAGACAAFLGGALPANFQVPAPKHSSSSAKILLKENFVELFAGRSDEAKLTLSHDKGISLVSHQAALLQSKQGAVTIEAKGELTLKSDDAVNVHAKIKHRNMTVLD